MQTDGHKRWKRKLARVPRYQSHIARLITPLLNIVSKGLILDSEHIMVEPLPDGRVRLRLRDGVSFGTGGPGGSTVTLWGQIIGTLSDQVDLQNALNTKSARATAPTANDIASVDATGNVKDSGKVFDVDGTLAANSDNRVATQKATKTYVDANIGSGGVDNFLDLTDTPNDYTGDANKAVFVKSDESGLEFRPDDDVDNFLDLTDTPDDYTGDGDKVLFVKADESGIEFRNTTSIVNANSKAGELKFGMRLSAGLTVSVLPFILEGSPFNATITGWSARLDTGSVTVKFRKKVYGSAPTADPGSGDRINTSGLSITSPGTTESSVVSDFTTLAISVGDIISVEIVSIDSGVPTSLQVSLITQKT